MEKKLNIALVAHDVRKRELVDWAAYNSEFLSHHNLWGTGTTARKISEATGLEVARLKSGPLGGDAEIAAKIANNEIDFLVFFCDNLATQGHQNDVFGLVRIASLYNIPFAMNRSSADMMITSPLLVDTNYEKITPKVISEYAKRSI